jgi:restriction system protein
VGRAVSNSKLLNRYPEFVSLRARAAVSVPDDPATQDASATETPEEAIERAHHQHVTALADDLLLRVKALSPGTFEKLVVELLLAMGYGGTMQDAGQVVGQSGDGGIDGVIKEDKLGLDMIYVQAKKWDATVGRPVVQGFAGSLQGFRARKGVFITTAAFSADARQYVERIDTRVVLIDGTMLARLMIEHNVGVTATATYQIKRVDSDYFAE